ncbi:MAG: hypothetical protein Q9216_001167 [Gyalolechia sp. 2 TL-2023]
MTIQSADKSAMMTNPCAADQEVKRLEEDIDAARGYERLLRANLASLHAGPSADDIRARITALELEKEELSDHLDGLRSGRTRPLSQKEKEAVDKALDDWRRKAGPRKRAFVKMWAIVREEWPGRQTREQLWDELGLEDDEK